MSRTKYNFEKALLDDPNDDNDAWITMVIAGIFIIVFVVIYYFT